MKEKINVEIREYTIEDLPELTRLWNEIVRGGVSFPQENTFSLKEAENFFKEQSFTACAFTADENKNRKMVGFYILHPNNVGRCSHIANASYGVTANMQGLGIGRQLVTHCMQQAEKSRFCGLQFNAVVSSNSAAVKLYLSLGMKIMATVKNGFRMPEGNYADTLIFFKELEKTE